MTLSQVGGLGAQVFTEIALSSRPSNNKTSNRLGLEDPTQPTFAWTQVASICFPVLSATPISPSLISVGIEIPTARTTKIKKEGADDFSSPEDS
uniref:Uncharacterized protein n=1 Tax=Oryza meridionalis TaxID=40149 RepID=A0A0E0FAC0_9ORYZ